MPFLYNCLQFSLSYFLFLIFKVSLLLTSFYRFVCYYLNYFHTGIFSFIFFLSFDFLSSFCLPFHPALLFTVATDLLYFIWYFLSFLLVSLVILLFWTRGLYLKILVLILVWELTVDTSMYSAFNSLRSQFEVSLLLCVEYVLSYTSSVSSYLKSLHKFVSWIQSHKNDILSSAFCLFLTVKICIIELNCTLNFS